MNSVVIVAGGSGSRMKSVKAKQFIEIAGKPLILWTLDRFTNFDRAIKAIVVLPENYVSYWRELIQDHPEYKNSIVTTGGKSRYHSVLRGLEHVSEEELVGIHDAVRPLVSVETIRRCYEEANRSGSAVPVIGSEDSLRLLSSSGHEMLDRSKVMRVQTPQVFKARELIRAYRESAESEFTDDASVYESIYGSVELVEGNKENIKITHPGDLMIAEALLKK